MTTLIPVCGGWPKGAHEVRVVYPDGSQGGVYHGGPDGRTDDCCADCRPYMEAEIAKVKAELAKARG